MTPIRNFCSCNQETQHVKFNEPVATETTKMQGEGMQGKPRGYCKPKGAQTEGRKKVQVQQEQRIQQ